MQRIYNPTQMCAVFAEIDFNNTGSITFDSQLIYRTHHGKTGSGKINYFFWAGDKPRMVRDKAQAINVRAGIGYTDTITDISRLN